MTDKTTYKTTDESAMADPQSADLELRKRLLRRIAAAVVLIAILLGGLAVFDNLNTPLPPAKTVAEGPVLAVSEPKPVEAKAEEKSSDPVPEAGSAEEEKKAEDAPAIAEATTSPAAPNKLARPGRVDRPLTKPAEPRLALMKPSEPPAAAKPAEPAAQLVRPPRLPAPASRPLTQPPGQAGNFMLQLGVFSSTANAEELRAKLEINGIPSQIEARVQVGPFKNRLEAEQMRDKLKQLGMEAGMLVAIKR